MNADFFTGFGIFVVREFLCAELCARLIDEARRALAVPATVRRQGSDYVVDEDLRRTRIADVSDEISSLVQERLLAKKAALESHFDVTTSGCRPPQFLVYRHGDFFGPHADSSREPDAPRMATGRQVSVVIFLNPESEAPLPGGYSGGSLTFYGLWDDPAMTNYGFPLTGEAGMLVAFRPDVVHEVRPVTAGERYTIVSWLDA